MKIKYVLILSMFFGSAFLEKQVFGSGEGSKTNTTTPSLASWDKEYASMLYWLIGGSERASSYLTENNKIFGGSKRLQNFKEGLPSQDLLAVFSNIYKNVDSPPDLKIINSPLNNSNPVNAGYDPGPISKALAIIFSKFTSNCLVTVPSGNNGFYSFTVYDDLNNSAELQSAQAFGSLQQVINNIQPIQPELGIISNGTTATMFGNLPLNSTTNPIRRVAYQFTGSSPEILSPYSGAKDGTIIVAKLNSSSTDPKDLFSESSCYGDFLTTKWLGQFATLLLKKTVPYQNMKPLSRIDTVSTAYIEQHLAPALQALDGAVSSTIDTNNLSISSLNFIPGSFNSTVISQIQNNTNMSFSIFQGRNQIGALVPGQNTVALYGAAHEQGDIVFYPQTGNDGSFRVSFKKGSGLSKNAANFLNDDFLCVQIIKDDFPSETNSDIVSMISRTQCINLSKSINLSQIQAQMQAPMYVTLKIEDNMLVMNGGSPSVIDQSKISMYYPSIQSIVVPTANNISFPYLLLPSTITNSTIKGWVDFINIVMGIIQTGYGKIILPSDITKAMSDAESFYWVAQDGSSFGDLSNSTSIIKNGKSVGQAVISGMLATTFATDVPTIDQLQDYLSFQNPPLKSITAANLALLQKTITITIPQDTTLSNLVMTDASNLYSFSNAAALYAAINAGEVASGVIENNSLTLTFKGGSSTAKSNGSPVLVAYNKPNPKDGFVNNNVANGNKVIIQKQVNKPSKDTAKSKKDNKKPAKDKVKTDTDKVSKKDDSKKKNKKTKKKKDEDNNQ